MLDSIWRIKDKIVGRAAALMMVKLGIRNLHAGMLSARGQEVLDHFHVEYSYTNLVEKILCKTEDILKDEMNPATAFHLLSKRAGRVLESKLG